MTTILVAVLALLQFSSAFVVRPNNSGSSKIATTTGARFHDDGYYSNFRGAFVGRPRAKIILQINPYPYKVQSLPTQDATTGEPTATTPKQTAEQVPNVDVVLEALEKRLNGESLTSAETNRVLEASDVLLEHLKRAKEEEETPAASRSIEAPAVGENPVASADPSAVEDAASHDATPDFALPREVLAAVAQTTSSEEDYAAQEKLLEAVGDMDASTVTSMINSGVQMSPETTNIAFWAVVNAVDTAEAKDEALPASVPIMLHHIFDADLRHLLTREQIRTNVTCMMPSTKGLSKSGLAYVFDDSAAKDLELTEGRRCEGGTCCAECSRNIFPTFASEEETDMTTYPEIGSITFNDLEKVSAKTILQFTRLIERVRRTIAHEYGLSLKTILPLQAYSRKYVAGTTQQGGGGGEGDFVTLHTDEATHDGYHYSCVLYLSTAGKDFEGGDFVFNDPADPEELEALKKEVEEKNKEANKVDENLLDMLKKGELPDDLVIGSPDDRDEETHYAQLEEEIRKSGRKLTPYSPTKGAAVIFSSGWENMHEVEKITSGIRYAVPCFFTTCPVPDMAYQQMNVGKPGNDEDIADDWLHLLLAHRQESPIESVGRVKELLMKWHYMCTPLSEH